MNSRDRRHAAGGPRCAPARRESAALRALASIMYCFVVLIPTISFSSIARAQDHASGDEEATTGIYLVSGSGHQQGSFTGAVHVNTLLGADRFYDAGLTGTSAVIASVEAGHLWNGHETLSHAEFIPTSGSALGQVDRHATWVAMVLGGRQGGSSPGLHQQGMAPDAQLFSGAIATNWPTAETRYTSSFLYSPSGISTYGPYRAAFLTGLGPAGQTRTADVINSSYVGSAFGMSLTGSDRLAGTLDALASENPRTLMSFAAGNTLPSGTGPNRVPSPASGYNGLAVAALTSNGGAYNLPSSFSNGGPNDYDDPTGAFVSAARQVIDIAAPGENFSTAYYGGQTGGNGPTLSGPANGPAGGPDWYSRNVSGTSFASPTVAGGAGLLYDAAHTMLAGTPDARDARVMKSVLMNSADKTLGWDNGQVAHANGNGGVMTSQGLDDRVGAGRLNLDTAFDQFLSGTTDIAGTAQGLLGAVDRIGWDFGLVAEGLTNDYLIDELLMGGSTFTATLNWFRDRSTSGTTNFTERSQDNLDLELWSAGGGTALDLIAESTSIYNTAEHFSFMLPRTGEYLLRVRWTDELFDMVADINSEHYGLAWSGTAVPEPASVVLLLVAISMMSARGPRRT